MSTKTTYHIVLLLLICILSFFIHLGSNTPPTIMEARNFIAAHEMVESNDWLIPTINGDIRIRKPPLPTWLTATSILITNDPHNLTILRIPAALLGTVMIFFLYGLVRDLLKNNTAAFFAAAVLATFYMFIEESRTGAWDICCHSFMTGAIWMLYRATQKHTFSYWVASGALMGLSFLSKGPVSFYAMLLPFIAAFFISKHQFNHRSGIIICLATALVISISWPLYLYVKIPDLAAQILREETHAWINRHNRPIWFYLHFPLFTGIWALVVVFAFGQYRRFKTIFDPSKVKLIFFWFLTTLVLLSVIPEKKERYFLPALPALAVMAGMLIAFHQQQIKKGLAERKDKILLTIQGILVALMAIFIPFFDGIYGYGFNEKNITGFVVSSLAWLIFLIVMVSWLRRRLYYIYTFTLISIILFCLTSWPTVENFKRDNPAYRDLRDIRDIKAINHWPVYSIIPLNPIRLWEISQKVTFIPKAAMPQKKAIIISSKPITGASKIICFHPNPEEEKEVLYFNIMSPINQY